MQGSMSLFVPYREGVAPLVVPSQRILQRLPETVDIAAPVAGTSLSFPFPFPIVSISFVTVHRCIETTSRLHALTVRSVLFCSRDDDKTVAAI